MLKNEILKNKIMKNGINYDSSFTGQEVVSGV